MCARLTRDFLQHEMVEIIGFDERGIFVESATKTKFGKWECGETFETKDDVIEHMRKLGAVKFRESDGMKR